MIEIFEEKEPPSHVRTPIVDKLPECNNIASVGAVFQSPIGARQNQKGAVILFGLHHSGCFRPTYLLVGN